MEQARFVHEARTNREKAELFAACRTGQAAVLVGLTERMGVGTNVVNHIRTVCARCPIWHWNHGRLEKPQPSMTNGPCESDSRHEHVYPGRYRLSKENSRTSTA